MKCQHCKEDISVTANSCPKCGGVNGVHFLITVAIIVVAVLIIRSF